MQIGKGFKSGITIEHLCKVIQAGRTIREQGEGIDWMSALRNHPPVDEESKNKGLALLIWCIHQYHYIPSMWLHWRRHDDDGITSARSSLHMVAVNGVNPTWYYSCFLLLFNEISNSKEGKTSLFSFTFSIRASILLDPIQCTLNSTSALEQESWSAFMCIYGFTNQIPCKRVCMEDDEPESSPGNAFYIHHIHGRLIWDIPPDRGRRWKIEYFIRPCAVLWSTFHGPGYPIDACVYTIESRT